MKKTFLLFFLLGCLTSIWAQAPKLEPVKWRFAGKSLGNNEYELVFCAQIDEGWTVYSQFNGDDGPIPTAFTIETKKVEMVGKAAETTSKPENRKEGLDPVFEINLIKFKHDYSSTQKIKVAAGTTQLKGFLEFQTCDSTKCLPPTLVDFNFDLNNLAAACDFNTANTPTVSPATPSTGNTDLVRESIAKSLPEANKAAQCGVTSDATGTAGQGLLTIFLFGFIGGLFALLTPCVFPMIPMNVSYFLRASQTRAEGIRTGLFYSASIIVIYVTLGLLITRIFGADALNLLSTHWLPNLLFFFLFVIFAFSFFGYFEITLPSSLTNASENAANKSGKFGIFFMAFTLALVSFSCTGPIIGTLLVEAADGGVQGPVAGMLGFSTALALPFGLLSAFPTMLKSMPKGGDWLNTVKVVLGFIEIGLAFKFLSKADLTEHWGILKYESFLTAIILCSLGLSAYLFKLIHFPHDSHDRTITKFRKVFGLMWLGFAVYVGLGFMPNERAKTYNTPFLLSGIAPPACYSYFRPCDCPAGINQCFKDYYEGVAYAKSVNKPIMVDFTGHGCENCRKMEDQVWGKDRVNKHLNNDYVLISLYVDDRKPLDSVRVTADGRKLRNVGNLWAAFEDVNFSQQSQPLYVLMSPDEKVLHAPVGAVFDAEKYADFLQCGLDRFAKK